MIVQFQFSDSCVFKSNWNEELKLKLREPSCNTKYLFTTTPEETRQWEMVYDLETNQFKGLFHLKTVKKEDYETLCLPREQIPLEKINIWRVSRYKNEFIDCESNGTVRYYSKQEGKQFLIVGYFHIKIWCYESGDCRTLDAKRFIHCLAANENTQELLSADKLQIKLWCMKTFKCLKTFGDDGVTYVCFLNDTLFVSEDYNGPVKIWNKNTGKCICTFNADCENTIRCMIHSTSLNLLIFSHLHSSTVEAYKIIVDKENTQARLELVLKIASPFIRRPLFYFNCPYLSNNASMQFVDAKNQTQVLVCDYGNLFIVDLISKSVIWKMENVHNKIMTRILVQ